MSDAAVEVSGFTPPYISFSTFKSFLLKLDPQALPPRVDRSLMIGMAGGTQTHLLQSMKTFGMIGERNEVLGPLVDMCGDETSFAKGIERLLHEYYAPQLKLASDQGTSAQLIESFAESEYTGSTLRKAVTFFLHAARDAGVALSPHFRPPGPTSSGKSRRTGRAKPANRDESASAISAPAIESHTIALRSGGKVTLSCSTSFMALSRDDRDFVFGLVDALRDYDSTPHTSAVDR